MKIYFTKARKYLFDILLSMWIGMLIADMALPLAVRFVIYNELLDRIVRIIGFLIVVSAWLFFRSYHSFHKAALTNSNSKFSIPMECIALSIAFAFHFLIACVFQFAMYVTGAGYYLGWVLYNGDQLIVHVSDVPKIFYILGTLATYPVYIAVILFGSKIGFARGRNVVKSHLDESKSID